ncbi:hypothetical protein ERJ75_001097200 [Trypanosoma vivax]|nr:hypothetical protein ERJ75_001097200 [Trypanosoma vivax]
MPAHKHRPGHNAGIYREHTVPACGPSQAKSSTLVATYKADKMDTIKALAKELESISTNKGNEAWKTACTLADTNWCTEEVAQARVKIAAIQQEEREEQKNTAEETTKHAKQQRQRATETGHKRVKRRTKGKGNRRAKEGHTREACQMTTKKHAQTQRS